MEGNKKKTTKEIRKRIEETKEKKTQGLQRKPMTRNCWKGTRKRNNARASPRKEERAKWKKQH